MVGEAAFAGLGWGAGEEVPFERAPFGVELPPAASFCSLTVWRQREMISEARVWMLESSWGLPLTLFTILPMPVARRSSSVGLTLTLRSWRRVMIVEVGSFAAMAFWRAAPRERISRRSMLGVLWEGRSDEVVVDASAELLPALVEIEWDTDNGTDEATDSDRAQELQSAPDALADDGEAMADGAEQASDVAGAAVTESIEEPLANVLKAGFDRTRAGSKALEVSITTHVSRGQCQCDSVRVKLSSLS
jgi:hypothetical protein